MSIPTVLVSGQIYYPSGAPAAHADVLFTLSGLGVVGLSLLVPRLALGACDAVGAFAMQVAPSPPGTYYEVRASMPGTLLFLVKAVVPANACQLTQIMQSLPLPAVSAAQQALIDLQATQAAIEVARQSASASAKQSSDSALAAGIDAKAAAAVKLSVDATQTSYATQFVNMAAMLLSIQTTVIQTNPL